MIKLKEFKKLDYSWFSINIANPYDEEYHAPPRNELSIHIGKYYWLFYLPEIFKPKREWRDTSNEPWNEGKEKPCGYFNYTRKQYGFTFADTCLHVYYGIQPGSWSKDDPKNSDHSKLYWYPWNLEHVRWDAYLLDGRYLCPGEHLSQYKLYKMRQQDFKDWTDKEKRAVWFQTINWFTLPKSDEYAKNYKWSMDEYDNWSNNDIDSSAVFRFYQYTDKYDKSETIACVHIEEREWIRGKWKWLRAILKHFPSCVFIKRTLDIEFRDEVGSRKGSWKGGVLGCSHEMLPGESVGDCWKRFCFDRTFDR